MCINIPYCDDRWARWLPGQHVIRFGIILGPDDWESLFSLHIIQLTAERSECQKWYSN
jgi:hypothetical protein